MKIRQSIGVLLACSVILSGCSNDPNTSNENTGRLIGGVGGALVGNKVSDSDAAPVIGAVVGSYIGGELGRNKDQQNDKQAASTLNSKLAKASASWVNDVDQTQYTMTVSQPYQNSGKKCRPFTIKQSKGGASTVKNGIACLDNGVWDMA
tara:strand:+ start:971 stop:1420 length:450 start_codon:yes stop_codon:yes gene_type:complete